MCKFNEIMLTMRNGEQRRVLKICPNGEDLLVDPVAIYDEPTQEWIDKTFTKWTGRVGEVYFDEEAFNMWASTRQMAINYLDKLKAAGKL